MPVAVTKAQHLVLDRRAIARPLPFDCTREQWRLNQPRPNRVVRGEIGASERAEELRQGAATERGHRPVIRIRRLPLEPRPIDCPSIKARRRARLEPPKRQTERAELVAERRCGTLADTTPVLGLPPAKHLGVEECPGRQNDRRCPQHCPVIKHNTRDSSRLECQRRNAGSDDIEIRRHGQHLADGRCIACTVGLDARPLYCRPLRPVEHPVMDRRRIRRAPDQAVERIDLADEMTLAQPANRRVTRHRPNHRRVEADQSRPRATTRRRRRRFGPGMPAANNDHVIGHGRPIQRHCFT